jgi:chromosome segregation ATPase
MEEPIFVMIYKRLKNLEDRIPVYEAKISDQSKKMQEIYGFPNDIAEVRNIVKSSSDISQNGFQSVNRQLSEINERLDKLERDSIVGSASIDDQKRQLSQISSLVQAHYDQTIEVVRKQSLLEQRISENEKNIAYSQNLSKNYTQNINDLQTALSKMKESYSQLREEVTNVSAVSQKFDYKLNDFGDSMRKNLADSENRLQSKINETFSTLETQIKFSMEKILEMTKTFNCDEKLMELKKDIDFLLGAVRGMTASNPDQEKFSSKMKMMETSIAQIFGLLKSHEG